MSDADYAQVRAGKSVFMEKHYQTYLRSGGADGHIIGLRGSGGYQLTTTLLVETFGRKSGVRRLVPLV